SRARFRTWLHSIVRNVMIDVHRKHGRVPPTVSTSQMHDSIGEQTDEDLDREIDQTYQREVFRWAARQVRKSFRPVSWEAFWRTAVLGEDVRRVAETLKRSTASIYTARSRVMAKLQEMVATFDPELTPGEISLVDSQDASLRLPSESLASESLPNDSLPKESTTGTDEPLSECHNDGPAS
ncbi:MAG: sigma-70 family RNA polymerase sigma factor, partial [Planctomycetota bacterium]